MKMIEVVQEAIPAPLDTDIEIQKVVDWYSRFTQFIMWPVIYLVAHSFLKIDIVGARNFDVLKSPFIIVSNHISFYDSFLFRIVLGLWTPHLPLRFMAVERFDWKFLNILESFGVIKLLYLLFGVFTVVPGRGIDENLKKPINIIKSGGNVVVYPEGRIVKNGELATFKKGAAVLQKRTSVPIIPVRFIENGKKTFFRKSVTIIIGGPISIIQNMTIEQVTDTLYSAVSGLHK